MSTVPTTDRHFEFRMGDPVVILYQGLYHGMPGRFLGLREDANRANIEERDGVVRSHPMLWLRRPEDLPDLAASRLGAE